MTTTDMHDEMIENRVLSELEIGQIAEINRFLRREDIELFAAVSGDINPAHLDETYAETTEFHGIIAHGMWSGALISAVLGTKLPGPGTIYLGQSLRFRRPIRLGDQVTARVSVKAIDHDKGRVTLDCVCLNQHDETVLLGEAEVLAPKRKIRRKAVPLPGIEIIKGNSVFEYDFPSGV
jgi:phosphate acetyltransferase/phosphate butyryltransferase